jgi:aspartate carbamoyltransferase regulatory subunit
MWDNNGNLPRDYDAQLASGDPHTQEMTWRCPNEECGHIATINTPIEYGMVDDEPECPYCDEELEPA